MPLNNFLLSSFAGTCLYYEVRTEAGRETQEESNIFFL